MYGVRRDKLFVRGTLFSGKRKELLFCAYDAAATRQKMIGLGPGRARGQLVRRAHARVHGRHVNTRVCTAAAVVARPRVRDRRS